MASPDHRAGGPACCSAGSAATVRRSGTTEFALAVRTSLPAVKKFPAFRGQLVQDIEVADVSGQDNLSVLQRLEKYQRAIQQPAFLPRPVVAARHLGVLVG